MWKVSVISKKLAEEFLLNQCFIFSRYLATGECGINPTIKVWELDTTNGNNEQSNSGGTVISEFSGHKYAVNCVVSPLNLNQLTQQ